MSEVVEKTIDDFTKMLDIATEREKNDDHLSDAERKEIVELFLKFYGKHERWYMVEFPFHGSIDDKYCYIIYN